MNEQQQQIENDTNRKLASLQIIKDVINHPNGDALDIVTVLGWKVVTKRDEYKPGDKTVFFEIDSVVPPVAEFDFLANKNYRVKTIKLRGHISQGLCVKPELLAQSANFPHFTSLRGHPALDKINENDELVFIARDVDGRCIEATEGVDLTDCLGVQKYVQPIPLGLAGEVSGNFPSFIPKTDELRVQSNPERFDGLANEPVVITEKLEGTSFTAYWHNGHFGVCSRSWELKPTEGNVYWNVAKRLNLDQLALDGYAIQGEIIGPRIQGNIYKLTQCELYVYAVWSINTAKRLSHGEMRAFVANCGLQTVPMLVEQKPGQILTDLAKDVDAIVDMSYGTSVLNPNHQREGIVVKPLYEIGQDRTSFKAINPQYLL